MEEWGRVFRPLRFVCFSFSLYISYSNLGVGKVPNPMGCTSDKVIRSLYNFLLCFSVKCIVCLYYKGPFYKFKSFHLFLFTRSIFSSVQIISCMASKIINYFLIWKGICWFQIAVAKCSRDSFCKEKKSPLHVVKRAEIWHRFSSRNIFHRGSWRNLEDTMAR